VLGTGSGDARDEPLPLIRDVSDHINDNPDPGWMPPKHKKEHQPLYRGAAHLPPSLKEAVDAFLLACAVRQLRGQDREHSSMLVHVTRFTAVQKQVHDQVEQHIRRLRQRLLRRIDHEPILAGLQALADFLPTSAAIKAVDDRLAPADGFGWPEIAAILPQIVDDIEVHTINGTAKDALDYARHSGKGLKIIAIGGDKLSRGLTLEGLYVSYFLRASKMYDTLMQMGRWFGYRPGCRDLCRLYTTSDHFTEAAAAAGRGDPRLAVGSQG
jgi:Z1 domain